MKTSEIKPGDTIKITRPMQGGGGKGQSIGTVVKVHKDKVLVNVIFHRKQNRPPVWVKTNIVKLEKTRFQKETGCETR